MATKIGVYFDQQNIGGGLDVEALAADVRKKWGDLTPVVKVAPVLATTVADMQADMSEHGLDGVLVCGTSPRNDWNIYTFPGVQVERVNLREQCVMAYKNPDGSLPSATVAPALLFGMAQDYVNMGVVKLQKSTPPEAAVIDGVKRVLVVGGGWTGLSAAWQVAQTGYEVVIVEKAAQLGGHVQNIPQASPLAAPWTEPQESGLEAKIAQVKGHKLITIHTSATMAKLEGQPGEFVATIKTPNGEVSVAVGAAVVATGWTPLDGSHLAPMGYGVLPNVVHAGEFGKMLREGKMNSQRVAFVLDTTMAEEAAQAKAAAATEAPAEAPAPATAAEGESPTGFVKQDLESIKHLKYSNAVASVAALRLANAVCDKFEGAQVFILYKHMGSIGLLERYYKHSQDRLGIMMTKADVTSIRQNNNCLTVSCANTLLGMDFDIDVDTVVLPTGMVPTTAKDAVMQFAYRQGPDFPDLDLFDGFTDSNYICFPYETRRTGVYAAGCVRQPLTMDACEEDAAGAALKAIQCIECASHGVAVHPRSGDLSYPIFNFVRCTQCKRCTEECPFGALDDDEKGTPKPNPARCRRCGTCFGACPERVISFSNYNIDQIGSMIREVVVPKDFKVDGPRVLILACENDAYPALDMAGMRRQAWSPYVRVIPVRCLGSVNAIWVSDAMSKGYDGVMMLGCKYGDDYQCHFVKGSEICNRRKENIAETLDRLGVEPQRVEQFEVAIDEYDKVPQMIDGFVARIIAMGPNPFKGM
ncbi:MAG: hydrogenase iron-sulfur subunit [Desulfovibrionaceae bacterium]